MGHTKTNQDSITVEIYHIGDCGHVVARKFAKTGQSHDLKRQVKREQCIKTTLVTRHDDFSFLYEELRPKTESIVVQSRFRGRRKH